MNLKQIRDYARLLIAEKTSTASYSSDTDMNDYINEGIKDMCLKGKVYEKVKSTTVSDGVAAYTLPIDALPALRTLLNPSGISLDMIDPGGVGRVFIVTGKPMYYYLTQTSFVLNIWQADTVFTTGDIIVPVTASGLMYEVTVGGMTGSVEPTYGTTLGGLTVDNNATLLCRELATTGYQVVLVDTPSTVGGGTGSYTIIFYAMDFGLYTDTSSPNFPEEKHHFLSLYAMFRHYVKMKDLTRASAVYSDYANGLGIAQQKGQGE